MNVHAKLLASLLTLTAASVAGAQQDTMPSGAGFNQPVTHPNGEVTMPQDADDVRAPTTPARDEPALGNRAPLGGTVEVAPPVPDPATGDTMAVTPTEPVDSMATVPAPEPNDEMAVDPADTEQSITDAESQPDSVTGDAISGTTGGVTVEPGEPRPINREGTGSFDTEARGGDATASAGTATIVTEDGQVYQTGSDSQLESNQLESNQLENNSGAVTDAGQRAGGRAQPATGGADAGSGS